MWKEIDWSFVVLHLDILVVANYEPCFCELEYVLIIANWTDYLASSNVSVFLICNRRSLNLLGDALLTDAIPTEEHTRQVASNPVVCVWHLKL